MSHLIEGIVNRKTAVGHGSTRKDTEKSGKHVPASRHLPGDAMQIHIALFVRVIPCVSVAELPFLGSLAFIGGRLYARATAATAP